MKINYLIDNLSEMRLFMSEINPGVIIDNLAGIGTFISSFIALIALRELIKQRRAMYQPSLFLNDFTLSVKGNPLFDSKSFYYYKLHNLHEPENKSDITPHSISSQFFLENIGYGIANKVSYTWEFDYKKAIKTLQDLNEEFSFELMKKEKKIMVLRNLKFYASYDFSMLSNDSKIDFIKPENLQINKKPISLPMLITSMHMDYVLIKNKMTTDICKKFEYENYENFPKPKLTITYKDIANKKYKNKYEFELSCGNSFYQKSNFTNDTKTDFALLTFRSI